MRGFCGGERDTCGLGEVVTNDAEIVGAPEIAGRGGVVASGDDSRAGQDEAGHGRDRATESDEHALKAREDAFAAGAVLAHDDRSGFAEPKRGSFGGRGDFEKILEHAAPRIPMRAGAKKKTIGARERGA